MQRGNGAFSFANRLGWKGPFGVSGYAPGTLTFADVLAGTGAVTIAGAHTTVFSAANTFAGSVFVGTRGMGKLRVDHASGLGTNSVSVTNGTLHVNVTPFRFGDTNHRNRRGVVTGSLSLWTNSGSLYIGGAAGATSNIVLVTAAGTLRAPTLYVGNGSRGHSSLTVSNGAQVAVGTVSIGASSTNNGILVTGAGTVFAMEGTSAGAMGGLRSQVRVEGGAAINNANIYVPAFRMAATAISNSVVVANGGVINSSVDAGGLQGAVLVTGSGSRITAGGIVGYNGGTRNELRVESGGSVVGPIRVGGYYAASPLCRAVVDNATVSGGGVYVGTGRDTDGPGGPAGTRDCELVVTNGGQVTASSSGVYIGGYYVQGSYAHYAGPSTNNFIRVFGGSTLRCGPAGTPGPLLVGYYHKSRGNELRVTGGTVTNVSVLDVGSLTTNIGNSVTISGGGRLTLDSASGARIGAGNGSTSNSIAVSDGGVLNARGYPITIGVGSGTWGNSLIAAGGGLGGSE
jgi:fibronectin-binding autotransporter adhesin